jgi:hypothetical protein
MTKGGNMQKKRKINAPREMTVTGFVEEFDSTGEGIGLMIATGEDNYLVNLNKNGKKLFDALDRKISVTGRVERDREGILRMTVTEFRIPEENVERFDDLDSDGDDEDFRAPFQVD